MVFMNERIRQLLVEAREQTKEGKWNAPTSVWAEKFAELIVRECGAVAYKAYWKNPETVRGRHIEEQIREHFGVE
jgi:hypothetical protein